MPSLFVDTQHSSPTRNDDFSPPPPLIPSSPCSSTTHCVSFDSSSFTTSTTPTCSFYSPQQRSSSHSRLDVNRSTPDNSDIFRTPRRRKNKLTIDVPSRYTSTPDSSSSSSCYSDRFIPSRASSNLAIRFHQERDVTPSSPPDTSQSQREEEEDSNDSSAEESRPQQPQQAPLFNALLRSELLGENLDPKACHASSHLHPPKRIEGSPLSDGGNFLKFQSNPVKTNSQSPTSVVDAFNLSPIHSSSQQRMFFAPPKQKRRIAKVPFKVLDAPALQDDFYLNLVDWSSQNVLAVGLGSCVYLWSACTSKVTKLCDLSHQDDVVTSVSWALRGTHVAVGTNRGEVQLWDTIACKKIRTMTGHSARIGTLAWSGPTLASGSRDRQIYVRDLRSPHSTVARLAAHKQEVCGLKWSHDEPSYLASGGNDNKLLVWDIKKHTQPVFRFAKHSAAVKAISWSPHQHGLLASGGGTADRCIRFWNALSGSSLNCIDTGSQVCNLAWSRNCNEIVSTHGYSLNQIVVWKYPTMQKVATLTGHTYRVLYLALSPDGSTIVTGAGDETLRFWQVFPGPRSHKTAGNGLLFPNTPGSIIR